MTVACYITAQCMRSQSFHIARNMGKQIKTSHIFFTCPTGDSPKCRAHRSQENGQVSMSPATPLSLLLEKCLMYKMKGLLKQKCFDAFASFRKVKKGTLLIDSSTIDPAVSREMAIAAEKMGAVFMDAPVSGGNVSPKELVKTCTFLICWPSLHI